MSRHTVTEAEFDEWALDHWVQFASSGGQDSHKRLEVNLSQPMFRVFDRGNTIYLGGNKSAAIAHYNSRP